MLNKDAMSRRNTKEQAKKERLDEETFVKQQSRMNENKEWLAQNVMLQKITKPRQEETERLRKPDEKAALQKAAEQRTWQIKPTLQREKMEVDDHQLKEEIAGQRQVMKK